MFHLMMAFLACARVASGLSASLSVGAPPVRAAATSSGRVGTVLIRNTQRTVPIDVDALESATRALLGRLRCGDFDVGIWLTSDATIRKLNTQFRGKRKSTDILSFPFHDEHEAGALPDCVDRSEEDELNLGDMVVSVPYVLRRALRDGGRPDDSGHRGVAAAMAPVEDVEERVQMLLVHGLCHLLNYDHETEEDFESMVALEEDLLETLREWRAARRRRAAAGGS